MSDEQKILMLSPARDTLATLVPGTVQISADCGHRAWISPSGLLMQLGGGIVTRCQDCVDPAGVAELGIGPGQREELAAILGAAVADQLIAEATADPASTVRQLQADSWRKRKRRRSS